MLGIWYFKGKAKTKCIPQLFWYYSFPSPRSIVLYKSCDIVKSNEKEICKMEIDRKSSLLAIVVIAMELYRCYIALSTQSASGRIYHLYCVLPPLSNTQCSFDHCKKSLYTEKYSMKANHNPDKCADYE